MEILVSLSSSNVHSPGIQTTETWYVKFDTAGAMISSPVAWPVD